MEHPGKQTKIDYRKNIGNLCSCDLTVLKANKYFNQDCCQQVVNKRVERLVYIFPSYYCYNKRNNNAHAQYKLDSMLHQVRNALTKTLFIVLAARDSIDRILNHHLHRLCVQLPVNHL